MPHSTGWSHDEADVVSKTDEMWVLFGRHELGRGHALVVGGLVGSFFYSRYYLVNGMDMRSFRCSVARHS